MTRKSPPPDRLRTAAESELTEEPAKIAGSSEDALLHELQVHQVELEMQNEALRQAQIALEESRDRYVNLYDFSPVGYLTLSRSGLIDQVNLTCATLLGEERRRLQRRRFVHFVAPEDNDLWQQHFTRLIRGCANASCELNLQRGDGSRFHARLDCLRLTGASPQVRVAFSDISDYKRAEQHTAEQSRVREEFERTNAAQYRDLVEHLHAGVMVYATDTSVLFANAAAAELLDLSLEQMLDNTNVDPDWCFQHEDGAPLEFEDYPVRQVLARDGEIENLVLGVRRPRRGDLKWLLVNGYPDRDATGLTQRVVVTFVDITERRAGEVALHLDHEQQVALREMLEDTVKGGDLKETLEVCLARLLAVSWLMLEPQGGIFTMADDGLALTMAASHNLSAEIKTLCAKVPLGFCHCGRAAASRAVQFSARFDERHEIRFPGMTDHGHYNLPLISDGALLGVLVLYLSPGFERDPNKEQFLVSVSGVLAGFIRRKQVEAAWQHLKEELEQRVQLRTAELLAAKLEAERANQAKSDFLSRMSHELRTPLNAILGFGQLLELARLPGTHADNVAEVLHAGRHLLELINEMLDLARIESGRLKLSLEAVNLVSVVRECLNLAQPLADARGIELILKGACGGHSVRADRTRLKQVLLNLLSNAIKYNREQGTVGIACVADPDDDTVQIRISDNGMGLTAEQMERLFIAFERLGADQTAVEGTGIGLVLSKCLVELMDGKIGVESVLGAGSIFWVKLPLADDIEAVAPTAGDTQIETQSAAVADKPSEVLCIEDNPANLRLIERILAQRPDFHLLTASIPSLGLELALAYRPVLILLDINLPDTDGYAVMRHLRENPATRDIPVVAISANATPGDFARGKAAGFAEYLTKPLVVNELLRVLDKHGRRSHVRGNNEC